MELLYVLSLILLTASSIIFLLLKMKNKKRTKVLSEKHDDIERNIKDLNSSSNSFDERYNSDSHEINTNITDSRLNIKSINKSIEMEEKTSYMKNVFLTNVSNEIRNPLNGIMGFAGVLRTDLAKLDRDDLYEFADSISQSGESLLRLLSDIIDISRLEVNDISFDLVGCDLKSIIKQSVENHEKVATDKGLQLIIDNNINHYSLSDNETVSRIIDSVIDNAVKFTDKGYIKLSLSANEKVGSITISVKDTGIGIDPSYIPMVFEPFRQESLGYTTKYQGAGLSLPLAKKALAIMDGDINIESEKGLGTTVNIRLILAKEADFKTKPKTVAKSTTTEESQIPWYKKNIFLVEDDKINQILFTKLLAGCENLIIAGSGEDALEKLMDLTKDKFIIDFVLMDINLPGQYDGIKLMHQIKQDWELFFKIPFIAQTAYAMSNEREKLLAEGFDEYLSKPIKKSELISVVEKVL